MLPPPTIEDEPNAADAARRRLQRKEHFFRLKSKSSKENKRKSKSTSNDDLTFDVLETGPDEADITLMKEPNALDDVTKDVYEWAIVYENQRGIMAFSIPYYSALSLLPSDPYPFTIPSTSHSRSHQPNVSLNEYPLPDGTWRWVSKAWMIDMRSDSGDIQYDGFEYNWYFRTKGWRSQVGRLNFGGWVRRRRWVRLMMRPGKNPREKEDILPTDRWDGPYVKRNSIASSFPPSILTRASDIPDEFFAIDVDEVWQGDKLDFLRCRTVMKQLGRDGKKLEVWKKWVGLGESIVIRKQQWTEDEVYGDPDPEPSEPSEPAEPSAVRSKTDVPIAHIANVLRTHGEEILRMFVYPDSRAQLIELLALANILPQLNPDMTLGWTTNQVDFQSYTMASN